MADAWPRIAWAEAVWESTALGPLHKLVALAYADHARDSNQAWLTLDRLIERTGLSRDAANRARRSVVDAGWLTQVSKPNRRRAATFRLTIPVVRETYHSSSTRGVPLSSTPADASSTPDVPEQYASRTQQQFLPQNKQQQERDEMSDPTDEELATFSASHPGREREAVARARNYLASRDVAPHRLVAYFAPWSIDDLVRKITLPKPPPSPCPNGCDGGWLITDAEPELCMHSRHGRRRPGGGSTT